MIIPKISTFHDYILSVYFEKSLRKNGSESKD